MKTQETSTAIETLAVMSEQVHERVTKSGVNTLGTVVNCNTGLVDDVLNHISRRLAFVIQTKAPNADISEGDLVKYLRTLTYLRIEQVSTRNAGISSRDVRVPVFFNAVLSGIGRFEDASRALRLELNKLEGETMPPQEFSDFGWKLASTGLRMSIGLPRNLTVETDEIYRIQNKSDELLVAGGDVTDVALIIRSVIDIEFHKEVFGAARTRYISLSDMLTPWEAIIDTTF